MPFPFTLSRKIVLFIIVLANVISLALSAIAVHDKTGGAFQVVATFFGILTLSTIIGCLCHQFATRDDEASNMENVSLFGMCGLLGIVLAVSLTVHARQDRAVGLCSDFANAKNPCVLAGVQLAMAYASPVFALIGFIISWIDKFPGAMKVTPRDPITKAPSSRSAAYAHDLDGKYTPPPLKISSRSRNNSKWSDAPLDC